MHSRRDQVEAHAFMTTRLRSALLRVEPEAPRTPLRRTPVGILIGVLLGMLGIVSVALFSVFRPAAVGVGAPATLLVEKQTGNRYVFAEGRLRPVLNYASARLLLGSRMKVSSVSASSLARVPHSGEVGIVGAPDVLPEPAKAGDQPWLVCATKETDSDGVDRAGVTVLLGSSIPAAALVQPAAALVRTPDSTTYLVAAGRRMRVTGSWVTRALGIEDGAALPVRSSWADAVPAGPDLGSLPVAGRGSRGPVLDGRRTVVGQVLTARGSDTPDRHFLVTSGGLLPVGPMAVALALGDPATAAAYGREGARVLPLSPTALASVPVLRPPAPMAQLPPMPGPLTSGQPDRVPCALATIADRAVRTEVVSLPASAVAASPPAVPRLARDAFTADRVGVPRAGGLLARTLPAPGVLGAGLYLVVETGAKYPVADDAAAEALGYSAARAATVPASLLATLPTGPVLRLLGGGGA